MALFKIEIVDYCIILNSNTLYYGAPIRCSSLCDYLYKIKTVLLNVLSGSSLLLIKATQIQVSKSQPILDGVVLLDLKLQIK